LGPNSILVVEESFSTTRMEQRDKRKELFLCDEQ